MDRKRWLTGIGTWVVQHGGAKGLAYELNVSQSSVYGWVAGRTRPAPDVMIRIIRQIGPEETVKLFSEVRKCSR